MRNDTVVMLKNPGIPGGVRDALTEVLWQGARQLLVQAIESEVAEFLAQYREVRDDVGCQRVVRNGYRPERTIQTGIGAVPVQAPRVAGGRSVYDDRPKSLFQPHMPLDRGSLFPSMIKDIIMLKPSSRSFPRP